nr:hypothetical protein CFP56_52877 [Quercus suber]
MVATTSNALYEVARLLKADLVGRIPSSNRILVPTGTLGTNLWRSGDPIDLVYFSENTASTFWGVVEEAFEIPPFKIPKDAAITFNYNGINPAFGTSQLTIRYCPFHPGSENEDPQWDGKYGFNARRSAAEERNRAMAFDTIEMNTLEKLPNAARAREIFRATYARLHAWFTANGLLHRSSGYISSEGLLCLLYTSLVTWENDSSNDEAVLDTTILVEWFVQCNANTFKPGIVIQSPQGRILSSHITSSAAEATRNALASLSHSTSSLDAAVSISTEQAYKNFVSQVSIDSYLYALTTESYNIKTSELYHFIDDLPSTIVEFLQTILELQHRIWPHPIIRANLADGSGLHTTHIIAVKHRLQPSLLYLASLSSQANDFLMHKARPGVIYTFLPIESPQSLFADPCTPQPLHTLNLATLTSSSSARIHSSVAQHDPTRPFRSANRALSRALHDPAHQHTEFEVGYHDRFDGLLWMALSQWGRKATEDEDFIPEHRVLKLRRVDDGVVVWDREERRDWL